MLTYMIVRSEDDHPRCSPDDREPVPGADRGSRDERRRRCDLHGGCPGDQAPRRGKGKQGRVGPKRKAIIWKNTGFCSSVFTTAPGARWRRHGSITSAVIWLKRRAQDLEPGVLHPLAVEVMKEVGIDISHHKTKGVLDVIREGKLFSYVVTVCDESAAERCPVFPGITTRLHWSFPDPAAATGTREEKLNVFRAVRDSIKAAVQEWCQQIRAREAANKTP